MTHHEIPPHHAHWVEVHQEGKTFEVELIDGPGGFLGHRDPRAAEVAHLKCHDCGGPVFVRWFLEAELMGYSCDDQMCWPVGVEKVRTA